MTGLPGSLNAVTGARAPVGQQLEVVELPRGRAVLGRGGVDTGAILLSVALWPAGRHCAAMSSPVVVAEIVRSGFVEGHHYGSVVALDADGSVDWSVGEVDAPILPRSCNKPLQALGMVRLGLDLPPELLALACASHSGEPFHVEGVRRILAVARDSTRRRCRRRRTTRSTTRPRGGRSVRAGGDRRRS